MNVLEIPYNKFLGMKESAENSDYLLELHETADMKNHIDTIHASAQFALAEASSGKILSQTFSELTMNVVPVVRRVQVKYKHPAQGILKSKASIEYDITKVRDELERKKRIIIPVAVDIFDSGGKRTMSATFEWFIQVLDSF